MIIKVYTIVTVCEKNSFRLTKGKREGCSIMYHNFITKISHCRSTCNVQDIHKDFCSTANICYLANKARKDEHLHLMLI